MRKKLLFLFTCAALIGTAGAQSYKTIGTGTDSTRRFPSHSIYKYSYNQIIYTWNEMPSGGDLKITSIAFYFTGKGPNVSDTTYSRNLKIYMKNVTKDHFDDTLDCMAVQAEADLVYSGNVTATSAGWVTINLTYPFAYRNKSGNHLLITIDDNTGAYSSRYFRYSDDSKSRSLVYANDSYNIDPSNPVLFRSKKGFKTIPAQRPNIRLGYTIIKGATIPYSYSFNNGSEIGNWTLRNNWEDSAKYAAWHMNGALICGIKNSSSYGNKDEVVTAERLISLGDYDSLTISFNVTVGGYASGSVNYDYVCAFLVPQDTNWMPLRTSTCQWLGSPSAHIDYDLPYILHFGEGLSGTKLVNRNNETMTTTIANPEKGKNYRLIFVWRNIAHTTGSVGPTIRNLKITGIRNPITPEYTPKSTAQWYGFATVAKGADSTLDDKFVTFTMQDLANVAAATDNTVEKNYAAAYADGKVWYFTVTSQPKIGKAFIDKSNKKIYGFETTELAPGTLNDNVKSMSYNPADGKLYFFAGDKKLYRMDMNDIEHITVMGQMDSTLQTLAIDANGNAYGITLKYGNLLKVNLNNGATTLVGNTGVKGVAYVQSMAFDYKTGELFWASCNDVYDPYCMYYVDVNTGKAKKIGILGKATGIELTGLFTGDNAVAIRNFLAQSLEVYPNPATNMLHIRNVKEGTVQVYDAIGRQVMVNEVVGNEDHIQLDISSLSKGIYFVKIGNHTAKFVKE